MKTRHIKNEDLNPEAKGRKGKATPKKESKAGARVIKTDAKGKCPITGKVRYRERAQAKKALQRAKTAAQVEIHSQGSSSRDECRYYPCAYCKGFHLTSWETWTPLTVQVAA